MLYDFVRYAFNIVMCQDTCEPVCFKVVMMLNATRLHSLISVLTTLMFTQCHREARTCAVIVL